MGKERILKPFPFFCFVNEKNKLKKTIQIYRKDLNLPNFNLTIFKLFEVIFEMDIQTYIVMFFFVCI